MHGQRARLHQVDGAVAGALLYEDLALPHRERLQVGGEQLPLLGRQRRMEGIERLVMGDGMDQAPEDACGGPEDERQASA